MISLEVGWHYFTIGSSLAYGVPYFWYAGYPYVSLKDEMAKWLEYHNIVYQLKYEDLGSAYFQYLDKFSIEFENKDDALLFKLTWY